VQGARNRPAPPGRSGRPPECCPCRLPRHIRHCPRVSGPPPSVQAAEAAARRRLGVSDGDSATDRTGGERRAHRGHDLVLPIHLVDPLSRGSADWPLSPPCPSGPVTSLSLPENILRYHGSAVAGPREAPRVSVVPPRRAPVSLAALHLDVEWVLSGTQQVHSGRGRRCLKGFRRNLPAKRGCLVLRGI
jgi:hypothetical protein